ncbi:MAG: DUF2059 domain-containing protein [Cohaesibacter sp.]|jgi:hypothetical protein|nr:DUF2059 domain-containing protein [Cohaesibacter sp.]
MKSTLCAALVSGAIAFGSLSSAAFAQDTAKDTHLQAAVAVVEATGTMPTVKAQIDLIKKNAKIWLIRQNPALEKDISAAVENAAKPFYDDGSRMTESVATVWASYFKENELKEILAFFNTDAGQKMANYQARVIGESIGAIQSFSQTITAEMVTAAKAELEKKGHKF